MEKIVAQRLLIATVVLTLGLSLLFAALQAF